MTEEHGLTLFENRVLREMVGCKKKKLARH
jgi:hypothetical protein